MSDDSLLADLTGGRTVAVPVSWCPRLAHRTPGERANWRLISVQSLPAGRGSGETQASLQRWLQARESI